MIIIFLYLFRSVAHLGQ